MNNKHVEWFHKDLLQVGEEIITFVEAQRDKEGFNGAFILTDQRICFVRKGSFSDKFEPWAIERVSSVEVKDGILFYSITLHTSGDKMEVRTAEKAKAAKLVGALQAALHPAPQAAVVSTKSDDDPIEKLRKLGELHRSGLLTDEEFASKKATLLSQI